MNTCTTLLLQTCLCWLKFRTLDTCFQCNRREKLNLWEQQPCEPYALCCVTWEQQVPEAPFWLFLMQLPLYNRWRNKVLRSAGVHSANTHVLLCPIFLVMVRLEFRSYLECVCTNNCHHVLRELVDTTWQPFLKPVCFYIWIIFRFSVSKKKLHFVRSHSRSGFKLF